MGRDVTFIEKGGSSTEDTGSFLCPCRRQVLPAGEGHVRDLGPVFFSASQVPQRSELPCLGLCLATRNLMPWAVACA